MSKPHLLRTAAQPRSASLVPARLIEKRPVCASGQIMLFRLQSLDNQPIAFLPGQWIDCHFPDRAASAKVPVGGFTLSGDAFCEHKDTDDGGASVLELAVKYSESSRTARWLFDESTTGDLFRVRVGGNFVYPPQLRQQVLQQDNIMHLPPHDSVIFVAAGVGLNPILSILRSLNHRTADTTAKIHLLLSSKLEHLYALDALSQLPFISKNNATLFLTDSGQTTLTYDQLSRPLVPFITSTTATAKTSTTTYSLSNISMDIKYSRITPKDILERIFSSSTDSPNSRIQAAHKTLVYICGPPPLTDHLVQSLLDPATSTSSKYPPILSSNVIFEKWWDPTARNDVKCKK